jgi:TfoX/Sxy family transcriptional regulator of competence genes
VGDVTELAARIRRSVQGEQGVSEQRMFGGLAFLIDGNMAVATRGGGGGGLMVRVDPADAERLLAGTGTQRMEMTGRPMQGWLLIDAQAIRTQRQLDRWVRIGVRRARSLPPKTAASRRRRPD